MKISLVGACNLEDGYLGAAKALERLGHVINFIPAVNYKLLYPNAHVRMLIDDINRNESDVVLWWRAEMLNARELRIVKSATEKKFILYSWDDPFQWEKHPEMVEKCKVLDMAFSCCMDSVKQYKRHGCNAFYCPPGFDPSIHYPEEDDNYKCDVSIVCTNLYDSNITKYYHINRREMLQIIIDNLPDMDLRIYGMENFRDIFPNHYKGWISFNESHKVFYNSKINISTHIRPDGDMYLNERVTQIMGSGGLLLMDNVKGVQKILQENSFLIMDYNKPEEFVTQIKNILENYWYFDAIKKSGYNFAIKNLTWDSWAKTILKY